MSSSVGLSTEGDLLTEAGRYEEALAAYREREGLSERVDAELALKIARTCLQLRDDAGAISSLTRVVDSDAGFRSWAAAAKILERASLDAFPAKRALAVGLVGTYTTLQLVPLLRLAALRFGLALDIYEAPYGQLEQQVIDPASDLYTSARDYIVIAVHEGAIDFPLVEDDDPRPIVDNEVQRWTTLWSTARERSGAKVLHHLPAPPPDEPLGHLAARLPNSRRALLRALNAQLGAAAGDDVLLVDCERLSAQVGSRTWFDPRYWHLSKQAVALNALPVLARATAAVIAADAGLSKRCLVLDLDNTLWGGVIGEDGIEGIRLGGDAEGEAYQRFQEYLLDLARRGVVLAVVSKNDEADARLPFERHPDMRLGLDDIAAFVANWDEKAMNVERVAEELELGLDSLVFVDDNPVEREAVRRALPAVETIVMPSDPALFVQAIADYPLLEPSRLTREDANRTAQYRARAMIDRERATAPDLKSFLRGLEMSALVEPFDEVRLPRITQLISKTNQFNATTRRHGADVLRSMMADPCWVGLSLQLSDRLADHGLVAVAIAEQKGDVLDIDTFLMSCRVMGRTVETTLLEHLSAEAELRSCVRLRGTFVPSERNRPAADLYARHGFELTSDDAGVTRWDYDLLEKGPIVNEIVGGRDV
jgi:FkbH-like protein